MNFDVRSRLLKLGVGSVGASTAIPYMFMLPRTTDPAAYQVQTITKALQHGLRKLGCDVDEDGFLGPKTAGCLKRISGERWYDMTWLQLVDEVIQNLEQGRALGNEEDIESQMPLPGRTLSPITTGLLLLSGAVLVHQIMKKA